MNQRDEADRFSSDVDQLLQEAGLGDPGLNSSDYQALLKLAQKLAITDFSKQSKIRYSLRRRLLSRIETAPVTTAEIPSPVGLIRQLFKRGQAGLWPSQLWRSRSQTPVWERGQLFKNKLILAGLIMIFSLITLLALPGLQFRHRLVELLAQLMIYLPYERPATPHALSLRWQFRGEGGIGSDPVVANGLIYAGSNGGYVYALDSQTGRVVWRFKTEGSVNYNPTVADGLLYAASEANLYALDSRTGQEQWRFTGESPFSTAPVTAGAMVYVGSSDGQLYALATQIGQEQWRFKAGNAILASSKITGDTLYLGSQDRYLYAVEIETGREKWRFKADDWISASPVEVAGVVYVGSHDENLYVLDAATGQEKRRYEIGDAVRSSAVLADGMIYFGSYNSYLYAMDATTGQEQWRFKMGKQTRSSPIVLDGVIYIGSGDGYLYGIDAQTGAAIERYGVDSQIYSAPAALGDTLYFVSGKGTLYAVQRVPRPSAPAQPETTFTTPAQPELPSFQFTPGAWYILKPDSSQPEVIRFRGRLLDGAGQPVNGFSIHADNGSMTLLSSPSGPNPAQPQAGAGEWEIVIPDIDRNTGWWWLTAVRDECIATGTAFDPYCQNFTRLSESIKVELRYPDELAINADWTCHWDCQNVSEK